MKRYEKFKQELKQELERWLGPEYYIGFEAATKNNGVVKESILIKKRGEEQALTISLGPYWNRFQDGAGMQEIFAEFRADYESERISLPFTEAQLLDFNQMKERIVYRLINADLNRDLLTQVPHILFLDLAIVFSLQLCSGKSGQLNCLIQNQHLDLWGITEEELYPLSAQNTPALLPLRFRHICDFIGLLEREGEPLVREPKLYVLTNQYEIYGEAALLYPNALKEAADDLDSDLLILPSSVHEILIVPKTDLIGEIDFEEVVCEINEVEVNPEDILSNRIYQYDRKSEQVGFCYHHGARGGIENGSEMYQ